MSVAGMTSPSLVVLRRCPCYGRRRYCRRERLRRREGVRDAQDDDCRRVVRDGFGASARHGFDSLRITKMLVEAAVRDPRRTRDTMSMIMSIYKFVILVATLPLSRRYIQYW